MTYTEIAVTPATLDAVLANLWPRGREELRRLGLTINAARARFMRYVGAGESVALLADGEPVMVCGVVNEDGEAVTWFQATSAFEQHALAITRWLRRQLRCREVFIYSCCVHDNAARWFHALGMEPDGWRGRTPLGFPLTRFARHASTRGLS